ncbi:MAG: tRNA threonylcarbamoyladenosine dehydratase [Oscillospiraceae bacterium]|nr:tRNA threonylcarbamoyladenosine dehydratase [Oscillospiraceae bacterium]
MDIFSRTERLIGKEAFERLQNSNVIVFGLGGVGSYTAEALARSGVGQMTVVDKDTVDITNINRQLYALHSTVGKPKAEVARERILDINPECKVTAIQKMYLPENEADFFLDSFDYIIDAIDCVTAKISLAETAQKYGIPIISSMGTGNKLDPTLFKVTDIYKTSVCPLCRVMRSQLKKHGVKGLKVLYSEEVPITDGARTPASISFVPSVAGLIIAGEVIKDIIKQ